MRVLPPTVCVHTGADFLVPVFFLLSRPAPRASRPALRRSPRLFLNRTISELVFSPALLEWAGSRRLAVEPGAAAAGPSTPFDGCRPAAMRGQEKSIRCWRTWNVPSPAGSAARQRAAASRLFYAALFLLTTLAFYSQCAPRASSGRFCGAPGQQQALPAGPPAASIQVLFHACV